MTNSFKSSLIAITMVCCVMMTVRAQSTVAVTTAAGTTSAAPAVTTAGVTTTAVVTSEVKSTAAGGTAAATTASATGSAAPTAALTTDAAATTTPDATEATDITSSAATDDLATVGDTIVCYVCDESRGQDCGSDLSSNAEYNQTCASNCWTVLDSNGTTMRLCNETYNGGSAPLSCDAAADTTCMEASGVTECFYCCSSDYCNYEILSFSGGSVLLAGWISVLVALLTSATIGSFH